MSSYDVFCYGEIGVDNIIMVPELPAPERAVFPTADSVHIGGAAANTAVWLANFGFSIGLSGNVIGHDAYGRRLWKWLAEHPTLDLSLLQQKTGARTPFCHALVTPDGERSFLVFGYPEAEKIPLQSAMLRGARYVALDLYGGPERLAAAKMARSTGAITTIGDVITTDHPVLPHTSIVTNSAAYIRQEMPGIDVRAHAHALQMVNQGIVITTDGGNEVYAVDRDGTGFTCRPPAAEPVDATGAGDAFRAGLLAGLLGGEGLRTAVRYGCAAGSLSVAHAGAAAVLPSLQDICA